MCIELEEQEEQVIRGEVSVSYVMNKMIQKW